MALTEHEVEINGIKHTMLLNDDDAKRYGVETKAKKAAAPANKARSSEQVKDK